MKTLTQDYLRSGGTISGLEDLWGITAKRHREFPNLVFFKYDQLSSPMHEPIVQECRGLILDEADDWAVVSFPFRKFFNAHEGNATAIDWNTARVYEKLDGSLMTLYWYRGQWRVASNGTPDAGGPVYGHKGTFADLFWETWNRLGYRLPMKFDDEIPPPCFMFEMMTPFNRVVVPHALARLTLIGARELSTLAEVHPHKICESFRNGGAWECVRSFPLSCIDDCLSAASALNPMESEGYVVCDANWNRIKVKCPQYVALSKLKESMSPRHMLDLIRRNDGDEFLSYFPEMRPLYDGIKAKFDDLCSCIEYDFERLKDIPEQKAFALEAVKTRCSSALFTLRSGRAVSARDHFAKSTVQHVEKFIPAMPTDDDLLAAVSPTPTAEKAG